MLLKITRKQALLVAQLAINSSAPFGMGYLHYEKKDYTLEDIASSIPQGISSEIYVDYFEGRMVKLRMVPTKDGWEVNERLNPEYQSWCKRYPTWDKIVETANKVADDEAKK